MRILGMLRKILTLSMVLVLVFCLTACCSSSGKEAGLHLDQREGPYLILYAFKAEGQLLSKTMTISETNTVLGRTVYHGQLSGKYIVLADSGGGMTNASMTTQKMIDIYNPKAIIFTGIAGAVDTSVHIGDIIVCEKWATHDYGYFGSNGFIEDGIYIVPYGSDEEIKVQYFEADEDLIDVAEEISDSMPELDTVSNRTPQLIVDGIGVSGNQFIDQVEKRLWISEQFGALVTDMETAAVAQICSINNIPFIAFRSASDLAGGSGSSTAEDEINRFFKIAAENSAKVVTQFLDITP